MDFFKWFYPGMRVKRWVSMCILGLTLILLVALSAISDFSRTSVLLASFATALLFVGLFLVITAIKNMLRTFVRVLGPTKESDVVNIFFQRRQARQLERGPRVVVIGGGTGLSTLLKGIKNYTNNITAIVTVTDTGGSSGRLRNELDIIPPGDIRNCLVALADQEPLMSQLFQYRFEDGSGLKGHSFGNLFITALSKVTGDFDQAVKESSKILAIRGSVIPSTLEKVQLVAEFEDGTTAEGETNICDARKKIKRLRLKPLECSATRDAVEAIQNADLIIMGPGSLYTSVLPNLLIKEILSEILLSHAPKMYVANVMTQRGETEGYTLSDHINVLHAHTDRQVVDTCFVNQSLIPKPALERYIKDNAVPVVTDIKNLNQHNIEVVYGDLAKVGDYVRHDSDRLAKLIFDYYYAKGPQVETQIKA